MKRLSVRKMIAYMSVIIAMALPVGVGATAAQASGGTGWYSLCSEGSYPSYVVWPHRSGMSSNVAYPGQCVWIYMNGDETDIYGLAGGYTFYVGTDWYPASIATVGIPASHNWYVF
jgi:hypothetical protein